MHAHQSETSRWHAGRVEGRGDRPARGDGKAHARQQQKAERGSSRGVEDAGQIQGLWATLGMWE